MESNSCSWKKFQINTLGDHLWTCTDHSDAKKVNDWVTDQITDLFRTTHKVKTQQVTRNRGQRCGDIELADSGVVLTLVLMTLTLP